MPTKAIPVYALKGRVAEVEYEGLNNTMAENDAMNFNFKERPQWGADDLSATVSYDGDRAHGELRV